jgi:hypothetical protein
MLAERLCRPIGNATPRPADIWSEPARVASLADKFIRGPRLPAAIDPDGLAGHEPGLTASMTGKKAQGLEKLIRRIERTT